MNSSFKDIIFDFAIVGKVMNFGTFNFLCINLFLLLRNEFMQRDNKQKMVQEDMEVMYSICQKHQDRVIANKN